MEDSNPDAPGAVPGVSISGDVHAGGDFVAGSKIVYGDEVHVHISQAAPVVLRAPPPAEQPPEPDGFVGRQAELAYYAGKLAQNRLAIISGMAGVGKTALAARLARQVAPPEKLFWHSFHEGEGVDAIIWSLAGFLARHGREDLWRLLESARLAGGKPPPTETLFDYLLQLLAGGAFLICLDDFHFVDEDPLLNHLIVRLGGILARGELSILLTTRRMPQFATGADAELLEGLSLEDTRHLLTLHQVALDHELVAALHRKTAGNAQFLTLAIDALKQTRDAGRLISRLAESENIERYLLRQVDDALSGRQRAVMSAVAVLLNYPATRNAIEALLDGGGVRRILQELSERHLLMVRVHEDDREYTQHAIVQAYYYEDLSERERRAMHRRAGAYYESEEPDPLRAGLHFERAGEYARAAQLATQHVWEAINHSQAQALRAVLARFKPAQLAGEQWAQVQIAHGQVCAFMGERAAASTLYQEALATASALPEGAQARLLRARACRGMGELLELEDPEEALHWLERGAVALAEESSVESAALRIRTGGVKMYLGNYEEAIADLEAGLAQLGSGPSQLHSIALKNLSTVYFYQGEIQRAIQYAREAQEINHQLNDQFEIANILVNLGMFIDVAGDQPAALASFQEALRLAVQLGNSELEAAATLNLSAIYIRTGEDVLALEHLQRTLLLAQEHQLQLLEVLARFSLADLHLRSGAWRASAEALHDAETLAVELNDRGSLTAIHSAWAELRLAQGDLPAALESAGRSLALAQELGETLDEGIALRVLGQIQQALARPQEALAAFEQSLNLLAGKDPYEAARTRMQLGLALCATGDEDKGRLLLKEAHATFQQLGARRDLSRLVSESGFPGF